MDLTGFFRKTGRGTYPLERRKKRGPWPTILTTESSLRREMYSVSRSNRGTAPASDFKVSTVASRSGYISSTRRRLSSFNSPAVGMRVNPPGTGVIGCTARPLTTSPMSLARRFIRRARITTSGCVSTSGNTEPTFRKSGAARK